MTPGLQRRFYMLVLRALAIILFRQQNTEFRAFDSHSDESTQTLLSDIRNLTDDIKNDRY